MNDTVSETGEEVEVEATETEGQETQVTEAETDTESESTDNADNTDSQPDEEADDEPQPEKRSRAAERRIKRLVAEKRQLEAQLQAQRQPQEQPELRREDFRSDQDYIRAVLHAEREAFQREQSQEADLRAQVEREVKVDTIYTEAMKISKDFDVDSFLEDIPVSEIMAEAIIDSDLGAKIVVHLNDHPEKADEIYALPPARQAAALGRLEAELSAPKPKPKKSGAPDPINPVKAGGGDARPKYYEGMSFDEFVKVRRQELNS